MEAREEAGDVQRDFWADHSTVAILQSGNPGGQRPDFILGIILIHEASPALGPAASWLLQARPVACAAPACGTLSPAGEESQHTTRQEATATVSPGSAVFIVKKADRLGKTVTAKVWFQIFSQCLRKWQFRSQCINSNPTCFFQTRYRNVSDSSSV